MFPQFELFGRTVGMYGVCAVVGLLVCGWVCYLLSTGGGVESEDIILAIVFAGIGMTVGGHLLFGAVNLPTMISVLNTAKGVTPRDFLMLLLRTFGGSVFYGGFLGSLSAVWLYGRYKKKQSLFLDLLAVFTPLFHTFGRIGCFLGGCCYGIACQFGFTVHGNTLIPDVNGVPRFPVQLLEAGLNLIIFFVLLQLYRKKKRTGRLILIYMAIYAPVRFGLEFLRGDAARGFFLCFSTSQWISLLLFPTAILLLILLSGREGKGNRE